MKKNDYVLMMVLMLVLCSFFTYGAASTTTTGPSTITTPAIDISLVNQDPDPAFAGDVVEVRLAVENTGGQAAQNYDIEVSPTYPFQLASGYDIVQNIGTLGAYQQGSDVKIVKFKVKIDKDALAGNYDLKVLGYEDGQKDMFTNEKSVSISVKSKQNAEIIHIDKSTLLPGRESSLNFTINNVGNSPLRDLTFYWENSDSIVLPVGSDNTRYIKYLDVGESANIDYMVIADTNADPGLYKLNLHLTYQDSVTSQVNTISTIAGIYVGGETDFDVAYSESSSGSTSFSIANIGSNPASSVSVMIPDQRGWTVTGSNSVIIGNLNKGDYTVASFTLQSSASLLNSTGNGNGRVPNNPRFNEQNLQGNQSGFGTRTFNGSSDLTSNAVRVQIAYTDTMGQRRLVEKEVKIGSQSRGTGLTGTATNFSARRAQQNVFVEYKWYFIGAAALVIVFIIYMARRRKFRAADSKSKESLVSKKK